MSPCAISLSGAMRVVRFNTQAQLSPHDLLALQPGCKNSTVYGI